ncbi:MAG: AI-2E family transporter [Oscillospiraceae bacterium]
MELNKQNTKKIIRLFFIFMLIYFGFQKLPIVIDGLGFVLELMQPFLLGAAFAFILNVPMSRIEHFLGKHTKLKKAKRIAAWSITIISGILILSMVMFIVIPQLGVTINLLLMKLGKLYDQIPQIIGQYSHNLPALEEFVAAVGIDGEQVWKNLIKGVQDLCMGMLNSGAGLVKGLIDTVTLTAMSFIFSVYLLLSKEKIGAGLKSLMCAVFEPSKSESVLYVLSLSNKVFSSFLSGQCLEALILGSMFAVSMSIFRMPYAVLISVVISITAMIPIFGAFIGCGLGIVFIAIENPIQALWFVVLFLILQQVEGNFVYPYVVGNSVGLPSILVFMAVILGGRLWGIMGMLFFIPITSILYTLTKEFIKSKNIARKSVALKADEVAENL